MSSILQLVRDASKGDQIKHPAIIPSFDMKDLDYIEDIKDVFGISEKRKVRASDGRYYEQTFFKSNNPKNDIDVLSSYVYYFNLFDHPYILKPLHYDMNYHKPYIITEITQSLSDYLAKNVLTLEQKLVLIYQICSAVHYIHENQYANCHIDSGAVSMIGNVPKLTTSVMTRVIVSGERKLLCSSLDYYIAPEVYQNLDQKSYFEQIRRNTGLNFYKITGNYEFFNQGKTYIQDDVSSELWSLGILFIEILANTTKILDLKTNYEDFVNYLTRDGFNLIQYYQNWSKVIVFDEDCHEILNLIRIDLLQINHTTRDLTRFMNLEIFSSQSKIRLPPLCCNKELCFTEQDPSKKREKLLFITGTIDYFKNISKGAKISTVTLINTIDYIIQNSDLIIDLTGLNKDNFITVSCILFCIFDMIYKPCEDVILMNFFQIEIGRYDSVAKFFLSANGLKHDSIFFASPTNEILNTAILNILNDPSYYIETYGGSPVRYVDSLIKLIGPGSTKKINVSLSDILKG